MLFRHLTSVLPSHLPPEVFQASYTGWGTPEQIQNLFKQLYIFSGWVGTRNLRDPLLCDLTMDKQQKMDDDKETLYKFYVKLTLSISCLNSSIFLTRLKQDFNRIICKATARHLQYQTKLASCKNKHICCFVG